MFRGGGVCTAAVAAVAFVVGLVCLSAGASRADDDEETRLILFSGRDIWRNGVFGYGGMLIAPGGIDQDGLILKLLLSGGMYRYNAKSLGGETVYGFEYTTQILPGFRVKRGNLEAKIFMGADIETHRLWPDDPSNNLRGHAFGLRVAVDFWYEPTASTMATLDASLSSVGSNNSARAAFGWRVLDDQFYFGPEIAYFGSEGYRHFRLGGHFTGLKTDNTQWTAAGGWARDSDGRASPYVRLGLNQRIEF